MFTKLNNIRSAKTGSQRGFSMVECLFALAILSVSALAVTQGSIYSLVHMKRAIRQNIAQELALSKLEEYAAIDPSTLDSGDDSNEPSLSVDNISFSRQVAVTVNSDNSRTVTVTVATNESSLGEEIVLENTFALWGNV